jgi:hypothetical protein
VVAVRWRAPLVAVLVLAASCGEDAMPLAELAELCGQAGPVQILALERDEVVDENIFFPQRIDDRTYYGIRRFDHPITNLPVTMQPAAAREYAELDARVESIDRCGEDRQVLVEGADSLIPPHADDEPWLAQRTETRELFWIDPERRWTPRRVTQGDRLRDFVVDGHDVWELRDDDHEVVRHTLDGDAVTSEVVLADVAAIWPDRDERGWYGHNPELDELLVLRDAGDLISVDFATGLTTPVWPFVAAGFAADSTRRWILLWSVAVGREPTDPATSAVLLDRDHNTGAVLGGPSGELAVDLYADTVIVEQLVASDPSPNAVLVTSTTQLILLPGQQSITFEGAWVLLARTSTDVILVVDRLTGEGGVFAVEGDGIRRLFDASSDDRLLDDAMVSWRCANDADPFDPREPPCEIVRTPYATGRPEVIERDVLSAIAVPGDRWIDFAAPTPAPDAWRPDPRGELLAIDGATGERALVDRDVSPSYDVLEPHDYAAGPWHTEEIVYQVRDLVGDRTGLWRARFE